MKPEAEIERRFRARVVDHVETLAAQGQFGARSLIEVLGTAGLIRERWSRSDGLLGTALTGEIARFGLSSHSVGASLHVESFISMLRRFGGPSLHDVLERSLDGRFIGCVAASEPRGGSDLTASTTRAVRIDGGRWRIEGEKKFVTMATQADGAVVLAQTDEGLSTFLVPRDGFEIVKTHRLVGITDLDTSWVRVCAEVPDSHLLGRPGLGLIVLTWGLTHERLAIAAQVVGGCQLSLGLAVAHATERHQFGQRLIDHQIIRLRLAELHAELQTIAAHVRLLSHRTDLPTREVAGLKVTAARFGERCTSECMHVFGGDGYLEDESPVGRLWRDMRLSRIGGGTDEMMWDLVAGGLAPDTKAYERMVAGDG